MKRFLTVCALVLVSLAVLAGCLAWYAQHPLTLARPVVDFNLPLGTPMKQAARRIEAAGVEVHPVILEWLARIARIDRTVKAGSYEVAAGLTPWQLLLKITRGDVSQGELTLVEGWTFRQFRAALDAHPDLRHDSAGLDEAQLMARLGAVESSPEGLFFPDTYLFDKQSSDLRVLERAYQAMKDRLAGAWAARAPDLPLAGAYEALILASIVEKETGLAADRPLVASVFLNRLRVGMRLQTDPTVIYGLGGSFDGNLTRRHLATDGPYNTYQRQGLPPTPIAMPGAEALRAVLQPPASDFYYFVARGDGSSEFTRSLEDHNRAVARYQKRGRG
ncbi:MAG: endolytic transglycosylase MltG [Zoogloeaceae bacterium]|nr:endolytic transglycosylase MltG [Zoogloeaceae bacterium]